MNTTNQKQINAPQAQNILADAPRFMIQVYHLDNAQENPVLNSYAISCPDQQANQMLYDTIHRLLQMITYKPFTDGQ